MDFGGVAIDMEILDLDKLENRRVTPVAESVDTPPNVEIQP